MVTWKLPLWSQMDRRVAKRPSRDMGWRSVVVMVMISLSERRSWVRVLEVGSGPEPRCRHLGTGIWE